MSSLDKTVEPGARAGRAPRRRPGPRPAPSGRRGRPRRWPRPQSPGPPGPGLAAVRRYPSARRRAGPAFAPRLRPLAPPRRGRRRDRSTPEHVADGDGFGRPARSRSSSAIGSGARRAVFGGAGHDRAAVPGDGAAMPRRPRPVAGGADRSRPARLSAAKTTRRRRVGRRARAAVGVAPPCARLEMRLASPRVDSLSRGPREGARPREMKPGSPRRPSDPLRQQVTRR